jgi:glycosyltransferase involved in cell wall biosynthesis
VRAARARSTAVPGAGTGVSRAVSPAAPPGGAAGGGGRGLRIFYLSGSVIPSRAANSVHVMKMCQAFAAAGHTVTLFGWRGDAPAADPFAHYGVEPAFRLRLVRPPRVPRTGLLAMTATVLGAVLRGPRPDLVYARNLPVAAAVARLGVPVVYEAHNPPAGPRARRALRGLARRRGFARLVVISAALRDEYARSFPELSGRIVVAHDAADPLEAAGGAAPRAWPGDPSRLQAAYIGQLYPGKGMEVVAAIAGRTPGVDLHVVGGEDAEVAAWNARLAGADGVWFHGFVPHGALPAYFARFDAFLAPYQSRVMGVGGGRDLSQWMSPLKIFEYMAAGKPILCSDLPVLREVLEDGRNALLLPPDEPDAWVAALERLRADPALAARLGARAREDFLARHTWRRRAEAVLAAALAPAEPPC